MKTEIIDNLDLNDYKLHIYTVFQHFKQKIEQSEGAKDTKRSIDTTEK